MCRYLKYTEKNTTVNASIKDLIEGLEELILANIYCYQDFDLLNDF